MSRTPEEVIQALQDIQNKQELSTLKLCEPFSGLLTKRLDDKAINDVSDEVFDNPTPESLEADLAHYKELFSKLRFSYLEQVTKEKFIRAIVGDPPLVVDHQENLELERFLMEKKTALRTLKIEVADLVKELDKRGREIYRTYQNIQKQTQQLQELPLRIQSLEASVKSLKDLQDAESDPNLFLPLDKTLTCIEQREMKTTELNQQITELKDSIIPRKSKQLERLNTELQSLEAKSLSSSISASEAKKRKEEALGGSGDDLEERGRWWTGVETGLKGMLGIEM